MTRVEIIANDRSELVAENRRLREENVRLQRRVTALENQLREQASGRRTQPASAAPATPTPATTVAIANVARPDPLGRFQRRDLSTSVPTAPAAIASTASATAPPPVVTADPEPPPDDTAQRFSLLELD